MNAARPSVRICEMSARDGLQALNPQRPVPIELKIKLIRALAQAGVSYIEVGAFVSPKAVPQMADSAEVARAVADLTGVQRAALVPNLKYYDAFAGSGCDTLALFVSASESYSASNLRMSIAESMTAAQAVADRARPDGFRLRAHLSAAFTETQSRPEASGGVNPRRIVPLDQPSDLHTVIALYRQLDAMGCEVIALADTFGTAAPRRVREVLKAVASEIGLTKLAVHFHDTLGLGIANALAAFEAGVRLFDASVGGIGGSPFSPTTSGNVATEELFCLMEGMGLATGLDPAGLVQAGQIIRAIFQHTGDPAPSGRALKYLERRFLTPAGRAGDNIGL
jgi:hydroxymethylglutaryl-CoA lyase